MKRLIVTMNKLLKDYTNELGLEDELTLEQLIESHRYLRKEVDKLFFNELNATDILRKHRETSDDWIRLSDLQKMNVKELFQTILK
jgi:hypothetical protein